MTPRWLRPAMWAGIAFLWLPVALLVAYAFSADPVPFRWGGFSTRWFAMRAKGGGWRWWPRPSRSTATAQRAPSSI